MGDLSPRCVGTTGHEFSNSTGDDDSNFSTAHFSKDGTTVITHNGPKTLRTFILPSDLLNGSGQPHSLASQIALTSATTLDAYAIYPGYDLQDPSTNLVLSSSRDLPITLSYTSGNNYTLATYPFINAATEAYLSPSSLLWSANGSQFIAGSKDLLAIFDVSYPGSGPFLKHKTGLGRREARAKGVSPYLGCKGIITALSASSDGVLAAGTRERNLALYAQEGSGECITSFSLASVKGFQSILKGAGVTSLSWDPSGTYLFVAERQSDGISVFDMRNAYSLVAWLSGRNATTHQKLGVDVVSTADGHEVWAGGTDGCVRMWKNPGVIEGEQAPDGVIEAHSGPVASAVWHPQGAVLATCCGTRAPTRINDGSSDDSDEDSTGEVFTAENNLKIWTV